MIKDGKDTEFRQWFEDSNRAYAQHPGFIRRVLLQPQDGRNYVAIVEHESRETFMAMHTSPTQAPHRPSCDNALRRCFRETLSPHSTIPKTDPGPHRSFSLSADHGQFGASPSYEREPHTSKLRQHNHWRNLSHPFGNCAGSNIDWCQHG